MDSQFAEGELMTIHNDFHHGNYQKVLDFDTSTVSSDAKNPARILQLRAKIALGQAKDVLSETKGEQSNVEIAAIRALALQGSGKSSEALQAAAKLAEQSPENAVVQVAAGTVLQANGKSEEALSLLSKHTGSLEAVAIIVNIYLQQNRIGLALKEVQSARKWAQDSLLVNIAESWVGLRIGGDKYQQAFYEFEEMPVPQSVAEIHLGRLPEAEAALKKAIQDDPRDVQAIANSIVLNALSAKDASDLTSTLQSKNPEHQLLTDLKEKADLFDQAASKYAAKVGS